MLKIKWKEIVYTKHHLVYTKHHLVYADKKRKKN